MARQAGTVLYACGRVLWRLALHLMSIVLDLVGLCLIGLIAIMITVHTVNNIVPLPGWSPLRTWLYEVLTGGKSLPMIWAEGLGMLQHLLTLYGGSMLVLGLGLCWGIGLALLAWPFLPQCRMHKE
jgi:hypothetical protein